MLETLITFYHDLHQIPELEFKLPKTKYYIMEVLRKLDCTIIEAAQSGVCAFFDAKQKETLAFRSDMDALPITETDSHEICSKHKGCMHACGHDGHMAMLLGLALEVNEHKNDLKHNVLLIFQPAEETGGGAEEIIQSKVLTRYQATCIYGFHIWPGLAKGKIYTRPGVQMARSSEINIDIYGKSTHCADAANGVDALEIGTRLLQNIYHMERQLPYDSYRLLKFGKMTSGTIRNVISDHTCLEGTVRVYDDNIYFDLMLMIKRLSQKFMKESGCKINLHFSRGYPALKNDIDKTSTIINQFPDVRVLKTPYLQSEDFAFYQQVLPGVFFFLGTGEDSALHSDSFHFDPSILQDGLRFYKRILSID